jgi:hypothetical protein
MVRSARIWLQPLPKRDTYTYTDTDTYTYAYTDSHSYA